MILLALLAGLMSTIAIALARAMVLRPDPAELSPKPLNMVLLAAMGWAAATISFAQSLFLFGLVRPAIALVAFYALYRLALMQDLIPFYKFALIIGIIAVLTAIFVVSQQTLQRSIA